MIAWRFAEKPEADLEQTRVWLGHASIVTVSLLLTVFPSRSRPGLQLTCDSLRPGRSLQQQVLSAIQDSAVGNVPPHFTVSDRASEPSVPSPIQLSSANDVPLSEYLSFVLKSDRPFPKDESIEIEDLAGSRTVLALQAPGHPVVQDPRTVRVKINLARFFDATTVGALRFRIVFPVPPAPLIHPEHEPPQQIQVDGSGRETVTLSAAHPADSVASDWLPLATLVRLPKLDRLFCPPRTVTLCQLSGSDLNRIESVSADAAFTHAASIPANFNGKLLEVPHTSGNRLYLRLRDDPAPVDSALVPGR